MLRKTIIVWQVLLATLLLSTNAWTADIRAMFKSSEGAVLVQGLSDKERSDLLAEPSKLRLKVSGQASTRGMLVKLSEKNKTLIIKPRFPLRAGQRYTLSLSRSDVEDFQSEIVVDGKETSAPKLIGFEPSQVIIPANTLRVYLTFSEPMARGQARNAVALYRDDGSIVQSPFLNLSPELWDQSQKRLTLLLDPGRIKQGVGPNTEVGSPLQVGQTYRLVVSKTMKSSDGKPADKDMIATFRVGPAERRLIDAKAWEVLTPPARSFTPLSVAFDRIIDSGAVMRMLTLKDGDGSRIHGEVSTDGGGWSLIPRKPWKAGTYRLEIDPELEDVSGNNLKAAFDAKAGTIGNAAEAVIINITIE